jgi:hypothetical protein
MPSNTNIISRLSVYSMPMIIKEWEVSGAVSKNNTQYRVLIKMIHQPQQQTISLST